MFPPGTKVEFFNLVVQQFADGTAPRRQRRCRRRLPGLGPPFFRARRATNLRAR
jgi:hypothetical protein